MKKLLYYAFVLIAGACMTVSCNKDDDNGQSEYTIYLDKDVLDVKHTADAYEVRVRSNGNWTAEVVDAKADWVVITSGSGVKDEEGKFTVNLMANTGEDLRTAIVKVKAGTTTLSLTIVQRAKSGSWMVFDKAVGSKYYADYDKEAGLLVLHLSGGDIDQAGHIKGEAQMLTLNCYAPFAADPNRSGIAGGLYEYSKTNKAFTITGSSEYAESGIMMYDKSGNKKFFAVAEGSTLNSVCEGNNYSLSGQFVDADGNTVDWYYNGIIEFKNELNVEEDADGYIILRADDVYDANYIGDVDQAGTGKIYFDVRNRNNAAGLRLWMYTKLPHQETPGIEEPPYDGMITLGKYNVTPGYGLNTISPGYVETSGTLTTAYPSFAYSVSGSVNLERLISQGYIDVRKYNAEEYDILFDLKGTDINGQLGDIQKYRYIGKISLVDKKPSYINFEPSYTMFYYDGPVDGLENTGKYRFILGTDQDMFARLTQRIYGEFYGPLPSDESIANNKITLPEGTYTKTEDNATAVSGNYLNSHGTNFNPKGTFLWTTSEIKQSYTGVVYGGTFTITHEAAGTSNKNTILNFNLKCNNEQYNTTAVIKMEYKAFYTYCNI